MDNIGRLEPNTLYYTAIPTLGYVSPTAVTVSHHDYVRVRVVDALLATGKYEINTEKETWCQVYHLPSQRSLWLLTFNPFWRATILKLR